MAEIPNSNVNLATNIRDVLNAAGGSITNDVITFFQSGANPTIWAQFKPTKYTADFLDNDNRWLGYNGYCGINIPHANGSSGLDSIYNSSWSWDRPTGGSTYPYRLGDWRGYNTEAKTQLFQSRMTSTLALGNGTIHVEAWVYHPNTTEGHLLVTHSDKLGGFRLALRVVEPSGKSFVMTSSKTASEVANDSGVLSVDYPIDSTGKYTVTAFLTYTAYTSKTTFPTIIECYALPKSGNYVNQASGTFTAGATATTINSYYIANSLRGTYTSISNYGYNNPYQVDGYGAKQYFKLEVVCESSIALANRVLYLSGMTLSAKNVLGKAVTITPSTSGVTFNLYNSNFTQVASISNLSTDYNNPTICYLEVSLFSKDITSSDESNSDYGKVVETSPEGTYTLNNTSRRWGISEIYIKGV